MDRGSSSPGCKKTGTGRCAPPRSPLIVLLLYHPPGFLLGYCQKQPTRELPVRGDANRYGCHLPEHGWLGWSAVDLADAVVAARVCLRGRGVLPAADEHDIGQQQRIGSQSLLDGGAECGLVLDLQVQVRLAGVA